MLVKILVYFQNRINNPNNIVIIKVKQVLRQVKRQKLRSILKHLKKNK
jgi:hypothetical protein